MTDPSEDELEKIREQKKQELLEQETGGAPAPEEPIELTSNDHLQEVLDQHDVVLVDCYADWCGPCQMMEPVIEDLAGTSSAAIAKLDVDRLQRAAAQLGAQSIPTLILFVEGEPVERLVGAQDKASLATLLDQYS